MKWLHLALALAASFFVCGFANARADVLPGGFSSTPSDRAAHPIAGISPGRDVGDCCWLGPQARFSVLQPPRAERLSIALFAPSYARAGRAPVGVSIDGREREICCEHPGESILEVRLSGSRVPHRLLVTLRFTRAFQPYRVGHGPDRRRLTVLLRGITLADLGTGVITEGSLEPRAPDPVARAVRIAIVLAGFVIALVCTLVRPAYGLSLLVLCIPFSLGWATFGTTITLPKTVLLGVLAGVVLAAFRKPVRIGAGARLIALSLAAVLASAVLSSFGAPSIHAALRETLKIVEYLLTFAAAYLCIRLDPAPRIERAFAAVTIVVVTTALVPYLHGGVQVTMVDHHAVARLAGLLEGPNQLAGYLDLLVPLLLATVLVGESTLLERVALGAGAAGLLLTLSRGGIGGGIAGCAVVAIACRRRSALAPSLVALGAAWIGAIALTFAVGAGRVPHAQALFGRINDLRGGIGTRTLLWTDAVRFWRAHPWLGVGPGNFELQAYLASGVRTHANSLYVGALVEDGVIGLLCALAFTVVPIAYFARFTQRAAVAGVLGACVALALHQTVDTLWIFPKVGSTWMVLLALGAVACEGLREHHDIVDVVAEPLQIDA